MNDKVTIHFQRFKNGQGSGHATWRAWVLVNGMEYSYNYIPKPTPHEALEELMKHVKIDTFYCHDTYRRHGCGNEEEYF
jgi:hypothetical protein